VFTNPADDGSKKENMLYELMLKSGYSLTDKIELNNKYFSVNDNELLVLL